jgi:hypothetical protein
MPGTGVGAELIEEEAEDEKFPATVDHLSFKIRYCGYIQIHLLSM